MYPNTISSTPLKRIHTDGTETVGLVEARRHGEDTYRFYSIVPETDPVEWREEGKPVQEPLKNTMDILAKASDPELISEAVQDEVVSLPVTRQDHFEIVLGIN